MNVVYILIAGFLVVFFVYLLRRLSIQYANQQLIFKRKREDANKELNIISEGELLYWTCHVCGEMRPDSKISVETKTVPIKGTESTIEQNIRYCNDRPKCKAGAKKVDFIRKN